MLLENGYLHEWTEEGVYKYKYFGKDIQVCYTENNRSDGNWVTVTDSWDKESMKPKVKDTTIERLQEVVEEEEEDIETGETVIYKMAP